MKYINQPKTERGEKTLKNIISAAENVFRDKGYNGATVKDIAVEAGVSVGTFYIYFVDKKSIYDYLVQEYSYYIRSEISKRTAKLETRKEKEREGLLVFLEIVRDKKHIYNIIWESLYIDPANFKNYYMNFANNYILGLKDAVEDGSMRDDIDIEAVAWMLMGVSNFLGLRYAMFDEDKDLDKIADMAIDIIDKGLFI
ncbi:MAG: TetR/AcrR family transcriptional regulator [Tissierellia bacterium]|nr:TetR/AcrR family transcriptional regulator [Tissierellia bacterium]